MPIRKIMMVDDEPHIRRIGELSLRGVGKWQVVLAGSGREAIELAEKEQPDVILLDVMMPGMDGPATLAELRNTQQTAMIPVIFLTAKAQRHEVERYRLLGAAGVLTKPFDPMTLPDDVRTIIEPRTTP
jgi:two-component system, OmpR family, response regulator